MSRRRDGKRRPPKNSELKWKGDVLWCDTSLTIGGQEVRVRRSARTDNERLAEEWLARLKERIYREQQFKEQPEKTIEEALADYWLEYGSKKKSDAIKARLRHYKEFFIRRRKLQYISQIHDGVVAEYVRFRKNHTCRGTGKEGTGVYTEGGRTVDATIRKDVNTLHHMLMNHAVNFWKVKTGKVTLQLHQSQLARSASMANSMERDQVERLLAFLPGYLKAPVEFSLLTGLRRGNVWKLRVSQIDWAKEEMIFSVKTPKAEPKLLDIPITERIRQMLYEHGVTQGTEDRYVFLQPDGQPLGDHRKAIDAAFVKAGIERKRYQRNHLFRHTAGTQIYEETKDAVAVKEILGHVDLKTTMIYTHLAKTRKKAALEVHSSAQIRHKEKEEQN
jgi:integrase